MTVRGERIRHGLSYAESGPTSPPYASASSGLIKNNLLCLKFGALMDCRNFFLPFDPCLLTVVAVAASSWQNEGVVPGRSNPTSLSGAFLEMRAIGGVVGFRRGPLKEFSDDDGGLDSIEEELTNVVLVSGLRRNVKGR